MSDLRYSGITGAIFEASDIARDEGVAVVAGGHVDVVALPVAVDR